MTTSQTAPKQVVAYTVKETMKLLDLSHTTIYTYLETGVLERYEDVGGDIALVTAKSVLALKARREKRETTP